MDTLIFNVEFTIAKGFFIALLIAGVISLKLAENEETQPKRSKRMGWIYVIIAATLEIAGVVGLKMFSRKKNLANLLLFTGGFALSYLFLYLSLDFLDMSIAYAV